MATLTGAQMVATGRHFAGIVSDDEELESATVRAGKLSGDLTHALPYAPEFFSREFSSKIADMRNSVKDRSNAQASCAGQFIANHLSADWKKKKKTKNTTNKSDDDKSGDDDDDNDDDDEEEVEDGQDAQSDGAAQNRRWLHIDMAGPSTDKGNGRGTGYGVPLLVELLTGGSF